MFVVEGRAPTIGENRLALENIYERVQRSGAGSVWVWRPHRQVAFGPRDVNHEGYEEAVAAARSRGYPTIERSVGGRPVAHTGSTLVFARIIPIDDPRNGLQNRYEDTIDRLSLALSELGVQVKRGEPSGAFCPGQHSLSARGKIIGVAQRVRADLAIVSGVVVVSDPEAIAEVLEPVYAALDIEFESAAVGSITDAGGLDDIDTVLIEIRRALSDHDTSVRMPIEAILDTSG